MKLDIAGIAIKWLIEKVFKVICFLWKKNPNYIILFIANAIITTGIGFYYITKTNSKKQDLAFYSYQKGQRDSLNLRELEMRLLKECVNSNNIHISNIFVDLFQYSRRLEQHGFINDENTQQGKYIFTISEINTKNELFCFNALTEMPNNKKYCVNNTKYLNSFYQNPIYSNLQLDALVNEVLDSKAIFSEDIESLKLRQPFFNDLVIKTNFTLIGNVLFGLVSYHDSPYMILTITTTEGYNFACNLNKILAEIQQYQQRQLDNLSNYAVHF
jgi:hypothetical protein